LFLDFHFYEVEWLSTPFNKLDTDSAGHDLLPNRPPPQQTPPPLPPPLVLYFTPFPQLKGHVCFWCSWIIFFSLIPALSHPSPPPPPPPPPHLPPTPPVHRPPLPPHPRISFHIRSRLVFFLPVCENVSSPLLQLPFLPIYISVRFFASTPLFSWTKHHDLLTCFVFTKLPCRRRFPSPGTTRPTLSLFSN